MAPIPSSSLPGNASGRTVKKRKIIVPRRRRPAIPSSVPVSGVTSSDSELLQPLSSPNVHEYQSRAASTRKSVRFAVDKPGFSSPLSHTKAPEGTSGESSHGRTSQMFVSPTLPSNIQGTTDFAKGKKRTFEDACLEYGSDGSKEEDIE